MTRLSASGSSTVGLVRFPGSNCDADCIDVLDRHFGVKVRPVWHTDTQLPKVDGLVLPGGFSYGDYLRSGALASHSPIMPAVRQFIQRGGAVIGICNGFQILTEAHLLPGALLKNVSQRFICKEVHLAGAPGRTAYHQHLANTVSRMPIAHGDGRYFIDPEGLKRLDGQGQIVFRYVDANGKATSNSNPNGAVDAVAGIVDEGGRVFGLMPHPERATDELIGGSKDGLRVWEAFFSSFA